jgi:two-component system sensor histidine kinase RegB
MPITPALNQARKTVTTPFIPTILQRNLRRLLTIRVIVFILQAAALLYARFGLDIALNYPLMTGILAVLAIVNAGLYLRLQAQANFDVRELFAHLLIDILGLALLLYFTGGANNPFVSYFLVPITIAAATLAWHYTSVLIALTLLCYTLLLFFYEPSPAFLPTTMTMAEDSSMPGMVHESTPGSAISLHIVGMWFNFVVSAGLITWFVLKMAAENRVQAARLSRYREDTLRDEQILALATQAAGTAHALGTPLGTMAVLLKELQLEYTGNGALQRDLQVLQQQVATCRTALLTLVDKADLKNQQPQAIHLREFIQSLFEQWQLLRPEVVCEVTIQTGDDPSLWFDATLQQALINMLNNAADASTRGLECELCWDADNWSLKIRDFGAGIHPELAEHLGTRINSTKTNGLGVGLVLSQATVNRLGGKVSLYPFVRSERGNRVQGTLTEIVLPLDKTGVPIRVVS